MVDNTTLIDMIKRHEGFEQFPYRCTEGKLTIGYGHNIEANGISKNVAELMLKEDMGSAIREISTVLPDFYKCSANRRMALIDFMFNVGLPVFLEFKKMITAIKEEDWEQAANELKDSVWAGQVGNRADELVSLLREG